jgi:hypothetical protein
VAADRLTPPTCRSWAASSCTTSAVSPFPRK